MENTPQENIIEELFQARYEKLDNIIIKKIHKIKATNKEEKESIKNAIIMEKMIFTAYLLYFFSAKI